MLWKNGGTARMTVQSSGDFALTLDPVDRPAWSERGDMFWEKWEGTYYFAIQWEGEPDDGTPMVKPCGTGRPLPLTGAPAPGNTILTMTGTWNPVQSISSLSVTNQVYLGTLPTTPLKNSRYLGKSFS